MKSIGAYSKPKNAENERQSRRGPRLLRENVARSLDRDSGLLRGSEEISVSGLAADYPNGKRLKSQTARQDVSHVLLDIFSSPSRFSVPPVRQ
jgi:hypothetical protein